METIGQILKRYRSGADLTVQKFAKITNIPTTIIVDIENDAFGSMSGDFYVKNYIKTYAKYFKLDYDKLVSVYEKQIGGQVSKDDTSTSIKNKTQRVFITPKIIKLVAVISVAVILVFYLGFQVKKIFTPPYLEVTTPDRNLVITDNFIEIRGLTAKEARVFINEKELFTDSHGFFTTTLDIQDGINLIKISAKKKHSKESVIFREILVQ